jgi:hypothetical protein
MYGSKDDFRMGQPSLLWPLAWSNLHGGYPALRDRGGVQRLVRRPLRHCSPPLQSRAPATPRRGSAIKRDCCPPKKSSEELASCFLFVQPICTCAAAPVWGHVIQDESQRLLVKLLVNELGCLRDIGLPQLISQELPGFWRILLEASTLFGSMT